MTHTTKTEALLHTLSNMASGCHIIAQASDEEYNYYYECYNKILQELKNLISLSIPADAVWTVDDTFGVIQPYYPTTCWMKTTVGATNIECRAEAEGVWFNIWRDNYEFKEGKYFQKDEYYYNRNSKGVHLVDSEGCTPFDFSTEESYDIEQMAKEIRTAIWFVPMMLESGRINGLEKPFYAVQKKVDNKLYCYDAETQKCIRISTKVVTTERYGNGYSKIVTETGRVYNLTTI